MSIHLEEKLKNTQVVVVGAGIIGLTTTLTLLEAGFKNVCVIADSFSPNNVSDVAGALWRPFSIKNEGDGSKIYRWCHKSYQWLNELMLKYGVEKSGIQKFSGVELYENKHEVPYWAQYMDSFEILSQEELLKEGHGFKFGIRYRTIILHPVIFMKMIHEHISSLGGTFLKQKLNNLNEINADIIVNCCGIFAKQLVQDHSVYPVRGQVIKVFHPGIKEFKQAHEGRLSLCYILPRFNGEIVVGGTTQKDNWSEECNESDISGIWSRACELLPELRNAKRLKTVAKLRPMRNEGTRLEIDNQKTIKGAYVIHNYAHGGSGHTIQRGCAEDATELALQCIYRTSKI